MSRTQLGDVVRIDGRLAECIAISPAVEVPVFRFVGAHPCPRCGSLGDVDIVEGCLNWDARVQPVSTSLAARGKGTE